MSVKPIYCLAIYIIIKTFYLVITEDVPPGNLTDFEICLVSHLGLEYTGHISNTESRVRCQAWNAKNPVHEPEHFENLNFSDNSIDKAGSYCRNPNHDYYGPWCYTLDPELIHESCGIPLCSFTECRVTGPGMEYAGTIKTAASDKKCLKWNKKRKNVKIKGKFESSDIYAKIRFPDEDVKAAEKFCRNPDGDLGGPWCLVEDEHTEEIHREYCEIPFCDSPDCVVFSRNVTQYAHYISFHKTLSNFTFGVKVWDPDIYLHAQVRLLLSLFPLPVTGPDIEQLQVGIELFLSNLGSTMTYGNKDEWEYEDTLGILKSTHFTWFTITWDFGIITLFQEGVIKPIFIQEYKVKDSLLQFKMNQFHYYSAMGTNILWSFPFCDDEENCEVHTTNSDKFQMFWQMRITEIGKDIRFFVRATHSVNIMLSASPILDHPSIKIQIQRPDNFTRITVDEYLGSAIGVLSEIKTTKLVDYWKYTEFSVSIFSATLQLHVVKNQGTHMITEINHKIVHELQWFSIGSDNNIAHWTLYCEPPRKAVPPKAFLPECSASSDQKEYNGTQCITGEGMLCLPWSSSKFLPNEAVEGFSREELFGAWNYCRNPTHDNKGAYCYTLVENEDERVQKKYCKIRKCKSSECRMSGTGGDYNGKMSVTRSGRECQYWSKDVSKQAKKEASNNTKETTEKNEHKSRPQIYEVDKKYLNDSLYSDGSISNANNYCRNPSRAISGTWCYTLDKTIETDLCNVRDCDRKEECIIIPRGDGSGREIFILPNWKETGPYGGIFFALKEWNPLISDGMRFIITPADKKQSMELVLGANENQKVVLYYNNTLIKEKTLPHLIPAGKWNSFWLQIRKGEIMLGFQGVPTTLFEWKHPEPKEAFEPRFLNYQTIQGHPLGIYFQCEDCHTENTTTSKFTKIFPINIWKEDETFHKNFTLRVRGTGELTIALYLSPNYADHLLVKFSQFGKFLRLVKMKGRSEVDLDRANFGIDTISTNKWSEIFIKFTELSLNVTINNSSNFYHKLAKPFLIYSFSVGVKYGWITWTANCKSLDLDGPPLDGGWSGWSSWQCTVSCGGGNGFRTRSCNNPKPNIFGHLCEGRSISTGRCNEFDCGDISPTTIDFILKEMRHEATSFVVKEGAIVKLDNNHKIIDTVTVESPKAYYEWSFNGLRVDFTDPDKEFVEGYDVILHNVKPSDSGIYVCMLTRVNKQRLVIRVISLAVIPNSWSVITRESLSITVYCKAVILGYVYTDLSQKWVVNNEIFKDHGITTLAAISSERVEHINRSNTGEWHCIIEQIDLGFKWTTNIVKIQVKSRPTIYTHLMEDDLTKPIFGWMVYQSVVLGSLIFIVICVFSSVAFGVYAYFRWCRLPEAKPNRKNYSRLE